MSCGAQTSRSDVPLQPQASSHLSVTLSSIAWFESDLGSREREKDNAPTGKRLVSRAGTFGEVEAVASSARERRLLSIAYLARGRALVLWPVEAWEPRTRKGCSNEAKIKEMGDRGEQIDATRIYYSRGSRYRCRGNVVLPFRGNFDDAMMKRITSLLTAPRAW